jgi:NlpC/P60 family
MRLLAAIAVACLLPCALLAPAASAHASGAVELRAPGGKLTHMGSRVVHVAGTRVAGGKTELWGVVALGGLVRAQRVIVPSRGFAGAEVEGLVVEGRNVDARPNTLVSLGPIGYVVALEEAVAEGAGGVVGLRIHLSIPYAGAAAGSDLEIGLAQRAPVASQRATAPAIPSAGGLPGLSPLGRTLGDQAVAIARSYIGTPYVWGGGTPETGFDCSGFTQYVYAKLGVPLTHYAASQWHEGTRLTAAQVRPGDLVFFEPSFDGPGHVGIYVGNGLFIDAPHTGDVIRISSFADPKWASRYVGAVRPY